MSVVAPSPVGTKGFVPRLAQPWIRRLRLLERLDAAPQVVVVSGPPGGGKTALLAEWFSREPRGTAWLSLDSRDNDPGRFGAMVAYALGASDELFGRRDSDITLIDDALTRVSVAGDDVVLVLDDVHELTERTAFEALDHLLLRAPACLSIALATRADPCVSLSRLKVEGRLLEVRAGELAFTADETAEFFRTCGFALAEGDTATLWERTEGWAAGLRLAAIALTSEPDPARFISDAARTEAVVSDYLVREVIERQLPELQEFLLRTSVADRLTAELAETLSGDRDARDRLELLERGGVFLTAVDDTRTMFRYHALFGALLRARLRAQRPVEAQDLARRAATWFADHDMPLEAEVHARRAGDWELLGALLCSRWLRSVIDGGGDRPLPFDLPLDAAPDEPALALLAYAEAVSVRHRADADRWRSHWAAMAVPDDDEQALVARLVDVMYGRTFGATEESVSAGAQVRAACLAGGRELDGLRVVALVREAELRLDSGDVDEAVALLHESRREALETNTPWIGCEAEAWLAFVAVCRGDLRDGESWLHDALESEHSTRAMGSIRDVTAVTSALLHAARGRNAHALSDVANLDGAGISSALLREAAALVVEVLDPRSSRRAAARSPILAEVLVSLGDLERVSENGGTPGRYDGERAVARARRLVDTGRDDALVLDVLTAALLDAKAGHPRTRVEMMVLGALAAERLGDEFGAREWVQRSLDAAEPEDLRAPFLDYGRDVAGLLERYAWQSGARHGYAVEILEDVRRSDPPVFVEPLTEREHAVLQYLPTMMSNVEIARELFVSVNTVKTHLKAVYRKLGVDRRRDAVLRARQLEIL